jgi:hypothetical protein
VAGDGGVGIDGGGDDAGEAGLDERIGAGRRAAGDVAGLEGDVGRAAANAIGRVLLRLFEGDDLRVVEEVVLVPALANDLAGAVENHAADGGVGRGDADAAPREFEGALHPVEVLVVDGVGGSHLIRAANRQILPAKTPAGRSFFRHADEADGEIQLAAMATAMPPLAVPSNFVSRMPVTPADWVKRRPAAIHFAPSSRP